MIKLNGKHQPDSRTARDGMANTLNAMMAEDESICYIDCDLMVCVNTNQLQKNYPTRAFNAGIAEANAMGIAAGLSSEGKKVWYHTFGCFASRRAYDQAYMSVAYSKLNVKVLGSDAGVSATFNGGTHMPFEDAATYMSIPGTVVCDPCDSTQIAELTKLLNEHYGLTYMRFPRKDVVKVYDEGSEFKLGKGVVLHDGTDVTIISSGIVLDEALKAYEMLKEEGISARVIDMFTWKPIDKELIVKAAKETRAIVTAENHNVTCGLGSAVANVLAAECPTVLEKVGSQDRFGQVGPQSFLMEEYNMLAKDIVSAAKKAIERK